MPRFGFKESIWFVNSKLFIHERTIFYRRQWSTCGLIHRFGSLMYQEIHSSSTRYWHYARIFRFPDARILEHWNELILKLIEYANHVAIPYGEGLLYMLRRWNLVLVLLITRIIAISITDYTRFNFEPVAQASLHTLPYISQCNWRKAH